ncbi:hypothetical protein EJB05_14456, partial [Eragrostis curvula]
MAFSSKRAWLALALAVAAVVATPCAAQNSAQVFVNLHNKERAAVGVGKVAAYAQSYAAQRQGDCALRHSTNSRTARTSTWAAPARPGRRRTP